MATYKWHKSSQRIRDRMAGPTYGPPKPYPFQREPQRRDLRDPSPGNPRFLEQRGGVTDFQRFRPGQSVPHIPRTALLGERRVMSGLAHLGLRAARMHPFVRYIDTAFSVAYDLDWLPEWAYQKPEVPEIGIEEALENAGFTKCCDTGARPLNAIALTSHVNYCVSMNEALCPGIQRCGTSFQIPAKHGDMSWTFPAATVTCSGTRPRKARYELIVGPYFPVIDRMAYAQVWRKHVPGRQNWPNDDPYHYPEVKIEPREKEPARAWPIPPLTPPYPAISIRETPRSRTNERINYRRRRRPYERPAVEVNINPRGNQPPHVPPTETMHPQLPPGFGVREKKGYVSAKGALALLGKFYDAATEAAEIVDILYNNLPKDKRCKGARSMSAKAYCVWLNIDHLNLTQSIEDIILNHYEDKLWGLFYGFQKYTPFGSGLNHPSKPSNVELSVRWPGGR